MSRSHWLAGSLGALLVACSSPSAEPAGPGGGGHASGGASAGSSGSAGTPPSGHSAGGGAGSSGSANRAGDGGAGSEAGAPEPTAGEGGLGGTGFVTGLEPTEGYPAPRYPQENPHSAEKALLGKILFWDEQLSSKNTHACGTCHRPAAGGADPRPLAEGALGAGPNGVFGDADDVRGSQGVVRCDAGGAPKADPVYGLKVQITPRKAPSALDAALFDELFWDGRATPRFVDPISGETVLVTGGALESQALAPLVNSVEMACEERSWAELEAKLSAAAPLELARELPADMAQAIAQHASYPELFAWAFGTPDVSARRIALALATYERELRSDQTPWDRFNAGDSSALTAEQQAGLALFNVKARCAVCHVPPAFTDNKFHFIGAQPAELEQGRAAITQLESDVGKMKTPSLRNVGLRAAAGLLHSGAGSGANLRAVVSLYRQGGLFHEQLDPEIRTLNLADFEVEQLLDFLQNGLTDERARDELPPFDRPRLGSEP